MATDALSGVYDDRRTQQGIREKLSRLTAATSWSKSKNSQVKWGTVYPEHCDGTIRGHVLLWIGTKDQGFVRIHGVDEVLYRGQDGQIYRKVGKRQYVLQALSELDQATQVQLYGALRQELIYTTH